MTTTATAARSIRIAGVRVTPAMVKRFVSDPESYTLAELDYKDLASIAAGALARRRARNAWGTVRADGWAQDSDGFVVSETFWFFTCLSNSSRLDDHSWRQYDEGIDTVLVSELDAARSWVGQPSVEEVRRAYRESI